ncbi:alpha/beta fold hydrolase [Stigmatella aurantiaca]|uniref:Hydrolase, alpha/beta fold family n=1 Tax=Stigmatella aurantiaca (strain DW4/3-1) TaxID=378806 RepID=Q09CJ5_STIAD|nr:alpha/beta hydrolase [Stigmatella aurantiaca]ADO69645.1 Hydrolase, alpha/beta fold family [Stigmatella aurantiaca DW4/3-1]EAU69381.1 hydrolase, alpha/beta fold family, putative [Stigmatella aurantiaca DW4/3-1]
MKHKEPKMVIVTGPVGRLSATVAGEGGIPVLFVHDNAGDRTHWEEAQHGLATRSVAFDLRGLGESGGGHGPFGVEAAMEDVAAVADALLPEKFVAVGHGFGAAVAGAFAAYYPERLAGLLYVEAPGDLRHGSKADAAAWLENFSATKYGAFHEHWLTPLLLEAKVTTRTRVLKTMRTSRREAIAGNLESLYSHNPEEAFEGFIGPTHALAAATGPETLVAQRPTLSRSVAPHASHWLMLDSPQWFHGELVRFLGHCKPHP